MNEKEFDYLNVIPLVDVMLVLLTIVLTTSTFIASGSLPVELPKASGKNQEPLKTLSIDIDKQGYIYINSRPTDIAGLKAALSDANKNTPILIRADKELMLQGFVDVLDAVKGLGFKKVSLETEIKR